MNVDLAYLEYKAYKLREGSLIQTSFAGSGHLTSALSAADIVAALFFFIMRYNLQDPKDQNNDRFILSKGHAVPVVYAAFKELGILTNKDLESYRQLNSVLEGHPTPRFIFNEAATGSLGQGLSIGLGMAYAAKLSNLDYYTYVMLGDSEMTEGSVWEAIELASYYKIDNLIAIVDFNRLGQSTETIDDHNMQKHAQRWQAFGWNTFEIDGHNMHEIINTFQEATKVKGKPSVIIAKTYKGYGLDIVENKEGFHGKALSLEKLTDNLESLKKRFINVATKNYQEPEKIKVLPEQQNDTYISLPDPNYKIEQQIPTRLAYGQTLELLGNYLNKLIVLDAEVKNSTYAELFEKKYPKKFIQCFIAEQNMIGMSVGLTLRKYITFSSTFASFLTRAFDQLRMAAIARVPLRIAGTHAGVSIGQDGPSQMGLEDIGMMSSLPNSIVLYPCDAVSTYKLMNIMVNYNDGISYIRLTRGATAVIYDNNIEFTIGGCNVLKQSNHDKLCIVAAGITVFEALKAYEILKEQGITVAIVDLYSIKPIDYKTIREIALKSDKKIVTVEDHYLQNGLGQAVCYAMRNENFQIECLAVRQLPRSGKPEELMAFENIDYNSIVKLVKSMLFDL